MPRWRATVSQHDFVKSRVPRLASVQLLLGDNPEQLTTLSFYVPKPMTGSHIPAVFLSLKNAAGNTFVRLADGDLVNLLLFMQDQAPQLHEPLENARSISKLLIEHEDAATAAIKDLDIPVTGPSWPWSKDPDPDPS